MSTFVASQGAGGSGHGVRAEHRHKTTNWTERVYCYGYMGALRGFCCRRAKETERGAKAREKGRFWRELREGFWIGFGFQIQNVDGVSAHGVLIMTCFFLVLV